MDENTDEGALVATDPTSAVSLLPAQAADAPHAAPTDFQSASLPHLGGFITKLIGDAHELESANAELERTKQLLREANDKLVSLSKGSNSPPSTTSATQLDKTKQQLRQALKKVEEALEAEQKENAVLKGRLSESETKLKAAENRAAVLEADLKKTKIALKEKNDALRSRAQSYGTIVQRLNDKLLEFGLVFADIDNRSFFLDDKIRSDLSKLKACKTDFQKEVGELNRKVKQDLAHLISGPVLLNLFNREVNAC
ncbi:hypothetical protein B0T20DRAFT_489423 [Sordaria brevicollis]|uniref:Uncharacterized protein n=1 Tax=Sordaria brevicollis TaxID=83679 RepID=A0AAE0P117_SORBR|nr:hypothetical protein B0T20DRAFT_489423 [Sordaria brevicollis]